MMIKSISFKKFYLLGAFYIIFANFAHPVTPTYFKLLGLNDYMFGVAYAAMALGTFLFSPLFARLASKYGVVKVSGLCLIGYGLAQLWFGMVKSEFSITIARFVSGAFVSGVSVGQLVYVLENAAVNKRGAYLGYIATLHAVISPFGYLLGGIIGDISIKGDLLFQAAGLMIVGILYLLLLDSKSTVYEGDKSLNPFKAFIDAKGLMSKVVLAFLGTCVFVSFATNCYEQCFNYYIKDVYNYPATYNGLLKAAVGLIALFVNMTIAVFILKKTNVFRSIIYLLGICALMMLGIIWLDDMILFIILNVIFFGVNAMNQPLLQNMLSSIKTKSDSDFVGIYNALWSFGVVLGALFAGILYTFGPKLSFVACLSAYGVAIVCSYKLYKNTTF